MSHKIHIMSVQVLAESKHATTVELAARESELQNMTQQLASKDRLLLERARHFPGVSVSGIMGLGKGA